MASERHSTYAALTPEYSTFGGLPRASGQEQGDMGTDDIEIGEPLARPISSEGSTTKRQWIANIRPKILDGFVQQNTGLLLVALSQAFLCVMNLFVKLLNQLDPPVSALELILVRMVITYVCGISYMYFAGIPDPLFGPKDVRHLLFFRGFSGFFGLFGIYFSLQYLSLSDATVLTFLAPICTIFSGAFFLGETISKRQVFAGCVSLCGVILIARPNFLFGSSSPPPELHPIVNGSDATLVSRSDNTTTPAQRLMAVGVALLGVLGATGAYTTLRAIGKRAHPLHSMSFFSAMSVIISSTGIVITKEPIVVPAQMEWLLLLFLIGVFGFAAQIFLTMGLARETAGRGSMAVYTQIIFASILERVFLHTVPPALSIIGTVLILGAAVYVAISKESTSQKSADAGVSSDPRSSRSVQSELEEGLLADHDQIDEPRVRPGEKRLEKPQQARDVRGAVSKQQGP